MNARTLVYFLESIAPYADPNILGSVKRAVNVIFESEGRESKKNYILGIVEFINPDGTIDYSSGKNIPPDIDEQIKNLGITTDELIDARKAYNQFQKIKSELF